MHKSHTTSSTYCTPESDDVSDEDFSDMNPSSPSAGPPPTAEQRGRSRRDERSRSRERTPPHSSSQDSDEISATVDPQNRVSDRSRSPQEQQGSRRQRPLKQKIKKNVAEKQASEPPLAKKHKSIDSDEDDEETGNEPGTCSNSQPSAVLPCNSGNENSEYRSEKTSFCPDLYVLTNDEHWTVTPETDKYVAAAGSFCFVTTENGEQQDICNLITMPCVQRSLYLNEVTNDFGNIIVEVPKGVDGQARDMLECCMATCGKATRTRAKMRSRARKEASAQKIRGYYKQVAEAKHLEYRSSVDNKVFDLIDLRKVRPKNMLQDDGCSPSRRTIKASSSEQRPDGHWEVPKTNRKNTHRLIHLLPQPRFRMRCQMAASQGWNLLHVDLKTAFL